jgi:hypothetical protein
MNQPQGSSYLTVKEFAEYANIHPEILSDYIHDLLAMFGRYDDLRRTIYRLKRDVSNTRDVEPQLRELELPQSV